MISPQQALKTLGRRPSKSLGQHFLIHQATAEKIAAAIHPEPGDVVVEIGAGLGALTEPLSRSGARVIAVEIDPELAAFLWREFQTKIREETLHVECIDILKLDLVGLHDQFQKKLKIIGNLPYNISSPVMFKLMGVAPCIQEAVLMLQDEVAERVLAGPGSKDNGILSVMANYHSERSRFMRVKPSQFHPPPKVDSQVISLKFRTHPLTPRVEPHYLLEVVKAAFSHRRKTLRNSLLASNLPDLTPDVVSAVLAEASIESRLRSENLDLQDFLRLAHTMAQKSGKK
ncbi:MAG: 16S rRNA (adenine(1518)-N(6)/adenine(1519)-N(6))-dimethyltransferase RsmA [Syntrophobacterales bacterium]|jgi:16S rRNA (adenine1518-N6/adenine1519-N6)-dimethyltransferase